MNQPKHTKEPWRVNGSTAEVRGAYPDRRILSRTGMLVAIARAGGGPESECIANSQRIVACVNGCEGINPDAIPDLLRGCQAALAYLADPPSRYTSNRDAARLIIRAAIRKATEGRGE